MLGLIFENREIFFCFYRQILTLKMVAFSIPNRELFLLIVIATFFSFAKCQISFACASDYCTKVPCSPLDCEGGRIVKNATKCGCCHICVKPLKEGAACDNKLYTSLPRVECGPGLMCIDKVCKPMSKACIDGQKEYDKKYGNVDLIVGPPRPECDNFGDFAPVQCKKDRICYCVDKNGERIFGTAPYSERDQMHCNCSRAFETFKYKLEDVTYFLRCTDNGNYDSFQCTDDWCYCMDESGELDGNIVPRNSFVSSIKCFREDHHSIYFTTPCFEELKKRKKERGSYSQDVVLGIDYPKCEPDGSYAPFQCYKDECYCVTKDGKRIRETTVPRYSKNYKNLCNCVREKELLKDRNDHIAVYFKKYECDEGGNYKPMQCIDSMCYCVDEMGFQRTTSEPVFVIDQYRLNC